MTEQEQASLLAELRSLEAGEADLASLPIPPGHHRPSPKLERIIHLKRLLGVEGATGAREWLESKGLRDDVPYRIAKVEHILNAYASSQLKKLDGVAQQAAEKIYHEAWGLWPRRGPEHKVLEVKNYASIISKIIAERLSK